MLETDLQLIINSHRRLKKILQNGVLVILAHTPKRSYGEITLEHLPLIAHLLLHREISHGLNSSVLWLYTSIHNYM